MQSTTSASTPVTTQTTQEGAQLFAKEQTTLALDNVVVKVEKQGKIYCATASSEFLKGAKLKVFVDEKKMRIKSKPNEALKSMTKRASDMKPLLDKCLDEIEKFKEAHKAPKEKKVEKKETK